jgi:hypothetical protein
MITITAAAAMKGQIVRSDLGCSDIVKMHSSKIETEAGRTECVGQTRIVPLRADKPLPFHKQV